MFISDSASATLAAGRELARLAERGDIFALVGDLGAGKTQLVKGLAAGLGSAAEVTSPTFTLVHEYDDGRVPIYHFDFYRLDSADAVLRLGFDEYLAGDGVAVIEWADRFRELIPKRARWITLSLRGESERVIEGLGE